MLAILVVYNILHFGVRAWGIRLGLESGMQVGSVLRSSAIDTGANWAARAGSFVAGGVLVLALCAGRNAGTSTVGVALAVVAGLGFGARTRAVAWLFLAAVWLGPVAGAFVSIW